MRIKTIVILVILGYLIYQGGKWGDVYYRMKVCEACSQHLRDIEAAKMKYRYEHPESGGSIMSMDLKPYLPGVGIPVCPWGGEYKNTLDLDREVECTLNGNPNYEPPTPGVPLKENGYMDLSPKAKTTSYIDYVLAQAQDLYNNLTGKTGAKGAPDTSMFVNPKR